MPTVRATCVLPLPVLHVARIWSGLDGYNNALATSCCIVRRFATPQTSLDALFISVLIASSMSVGIDVSTIGGGSIDIGTTPSLVEGVGGLLAIVVRLGSTW